MLTFRSYTCKVGPSDAEAPSSIFCALYFPPSLYPSLCRSIVNALVGLGKQHWIGEEAWKVRGISRLRRPVENGYITRFDDMELLWKEVFEGHVHADPKEHPILMTEEMGNPKHGREKTAQIVFESLEAPAFYLAKQSVLALYASGRASGAVFSCGYGQSFAVPIYEGFALRHAVSKLDIGGCDLTDFFNRLIGERGYAISTNAEIADGSKCKTGVCYVAQNYGRELLRLSAPGMSVETPFELPDGKTVHVDKERFMVPEALFNLSMIGFEAGGAHYALQRSIGKSDAEIQHLLNQNIVPAGGSTKYPGFVERLRSEMVSINPPSALINVISSPDPSKSAWVGGSVVASLSTFKDMCISAQEYEETGSVMVHKKCV
ncbi:unnamed protein product [Clonostachys chloroleuca]|uniref:Uncharacterized protein n=1 Tax=Clonostachys chloroleuca TaxID=1926264 RepID=A0AA35M0P5_9HYPO|nr:unnamed protein product [Clonostachys chloroleuca]